MGIPKPLLVTIFYQLSLSISPPLELNPYAMFVSTQHGGHLGFFEGGVIFPNKTTWLQRLVLQYSTVCRELQPKNTHNTYCACVFIAALLFYLCDSQ